MTDGRQPDASTAPETTPTRVPWWIGPRVRLSALLVCLAATVVALLGTNTSAFSTAGGSSGGARPGCIPATVPALASVRLDGIKELRADLLRVMRPIGPRYEWGTVAPASVWSDDVPQRLFQSGLTTNRWPGSYEMRAWARDRDGARNRDDVVADVFLFANTSRARRFFDEATSAQCHRDGKAQPASRPPGSRNLVWLNPDGFPQEDVFMLLGPRVYRIGEVRSAHPSVPPSVEQRAGLSAVDALACSLKDAGCDGAGSGGLSSGIHVGKASRKRCQRAIASRNPLRNCPVE
jgi:hypothetical protein